MFQVMSLNLNYFGEKHERWIFRINRVVELINRLRPDVIALQAVAREPNENAGAAQDEQLRRLLPEYTHAFFEPGVVRADDSAQGSALLARRAWDAIDSHRLPLLPAVEDDNQRVLMHARFDLSTGPLHLFNAHFSWVPALAEHNLKDTLDIMNQFDGRRVLVGDLNQPPDSPVMRAFAAAGWIDAWEKLHPGEPGYTFETGSLEKRIDYAWLGPETGGRVDDIQVLEGADGKALSDHLGLLVTLPITSGNGALL
jgi:endonuclease/exonuclease/phosphatase family metal-dependent hydrolase